MRLDETPTATWAPKAQALLRIVTGYLFLVHGTAKLFHVPHMAMFDHLHLLSLLGLAGILELVGGALVLIGLLTRPVAFVLSGEMAFAYFMVHAPQGFWPGIGFGRAEPTPLAAGSCNQVCLDAFGGIFSQGAAGRQ